MLDLSKSYYSQLDLEIAEKKNRSFGKAKKNQKKSKKSLPLFLSCKIKPDLFYDKNIILAFFLDGNFVYAIIWNFENSSDFLDYFSFV